MKQKRLIIMMVLVCLCFGIYHLYNRYENSYSVMIALIEKGDLKNALRKCRSPLMRGMGKYQINILEAAYEKDVQKTIIAIKSDVCYGKCYHTIDDWSFIVNSFLECQNDEYEILVMKKYIDSVRKKMMQEENLVIDEELHVVLQ